MLCLSDSPADLNMHSSLNVLNLAEPHNMLSDERIFRNVRIEHLN